MLAKETIRLLKEYPVLRATAENLQEQIAYKKAAGADRLELDVLLKRLSDTKYIKDQLDRGLSALTGEERLILERMYLRPAKGGTMALCEALEVELATVYRRRNKAIEKLSRTIANEQ